MNTPVPTVHGRLDHPSHPVHQPRHQPGQQNQRRVNLLDRAALHLGIALIMWGRRPRASRSVQRESREGRARRHEQLRARFERERVAELEYRLRIPPR